MSFHIIDSISSCFGILASIFFAIGTFGITDKKIIKLTMSPFGSSPHGRKALCQQKTDYMFGSLFLFLCFLTSVVDNLPVQLSEPFCDKNIVPFVPHILGIFSVVVVTPFLLRKKLAKVCTDRLNKKLKVDSP